MKTRKNLKVLGSFAAAILWASLCLAQTPGRTVADTKPDNPAGENVWNTVSPTNVDLRALKGQLEAFEDLLNRSVRQNFEMPFALLQDAKGSYLPGFGVAFHLEANLHPLRTIWPFDMNPYTPEELKKAKDDKLARIRELKGRLTELLLAQGGSLSAMAPEQNIAIVVHLFNLPSESKDLPTQMVIMVNRQMLLDFQARRMTAEEFQKAGSFLQF